MSYNQPQIDLRVELLDAIRQPSKAGGLAPVNEQFLYRLSINAWFTITIIKNYFRREEIMAGAFTHMAVVSKARGAFANGSDLKKCMQTNLHFLTLGSVSPDAPYLSLTERAWADTMHYEETNGIVHHGLKLLIGVEEKDEAWWSKLAWLLGYISHLVTDATIHPIVEALVGPYKNPDSHTPHRICEMVHDVMIMKEVKNLELAGSEYADLLRACQDDPSFEAVCGFWEDAARLAYPEKMAINLKEVFQAYTRTIDLAEGGNKMARLFRHFGSEFVYDTYETLITTHSDRVEEYYRSVRLPSGAQGAFIDHGFFHAAENVGNVWKEVERSLLVTKTFAEVLPNWDLDTGIDRNTEMKTYWS
jgi:hypothetical protein